MCFDFYPKAGGWLLSEWLFYLLQKKKKEHYITQYIDLILPNGISIY